MNSFPLKQSNLQTFTVVFRNKAHFGKPVTEKPKTFILEMFFCQICSICLRSVLVYLCHSIINK